MSKKTTDQKTEKQAEAKKPVELKDEQLDEAQGGATGRRTYEPISFPKRIDGATP